MGPTCVLSSPDRPHVGSMNLVIRGVLVDYWVRLTVWINYRIELNWIDVYWYWPFLHWPVQNMHLTDILIQFLQSFMQYLIILDRVITTPHCMLFDMINLFKISLLIPEWPKKHRIRAKSLWYSVIRNIYDLFVTESIVLWITMLMNTL